MTHDIYLNKKRKKIYMEDFCNVLNCKNESWILDANLKDVLKNINVNEYIQTLYSKRYNINNFNDEDSYLRFCYFQELELQLFRFVLPDLLLSFNLKPDTILYYDFSYPKENLNYVEGSKPLGLGCTDNKDYFKINHISINLKSPDLDVHNDFWKDIENKLVNLKPD